MDYHRDQEDAYDLHGSKLMTMRRISTADSAPRLTDEGIDFTNHDTSLINVLLYCIMQICCQLVWPVEANSTEEETATCEKGTLYQILDFHEQQDVTFICCDGLL